VRCLLSYISSIFGYICANIAQKAIIDEAKKLLMNTRNMTEEEAHRFIQKSSMDSGTNMVETAQMVLQIMH